MIPKIVVDGARVFHDDCRDVLRGLPDNSVDSIVTDPPYELGFMGKRWDSTGIAYDVDVWSECLRVLKPGGHVLAFGGSRTWHRLAVAVEDAGFGEYSGDAVGSWPANDGGGASRFFYVAKASKRDRNEGLEDLEAQRHADRVTDDGPGGDNPRNRTNTPRQNFHPTVKPTQLMRYLIKLVTPPGGTVLDPFTGSGSTGKAALLDGFGFVGAELTEEYLPIIEGRLRWAIENRETEETLF